MSANVAVFGAGIAGLTAAHELAARGYHVTVYDAADSVGGKARSQWVRLNGGKAIFPGEHGFRFFPAFYRHVPESMARIPKKPQHANPARALDDFGSKSVLSNLVGVKYSAIARDHQEVASWPRRLPASTSDIVDMIEFYFQGMSMSATDLGHLAARMLLFYTSCDKRRAEVFEQQTWSQFIQLRLLSDQAARIMRSFPKCLVAMDADQGSSYTIGNTSFLLLMDQMRPDTDTDRVLNGPTSAVWLEPWREWLERLQPPVEFRLKTPLRRLDFDADNERINGAWVGDEPTKVEADYYVLALPLDRAQGMITEEMTEVCEECWKLWEIDLEKSLGWMVGAQFYLDADVPVVEGHVFYPDSRWALTSVSQAQFWKGNFRKKYGNGVASGILSIDVSDWDSKDDGTPSARECTRDQIRAQLIRQINGVGRPPILEERNLRGWNLDADIEFSANGLPAQNHSRLLIHPPGLLGLRPKAETEIDNLLLASDYVLTNTDLATMEGANEAARLAVNAILEREGDGPPCEIFDHLELNEPPFIRAAKKLDEVRYRAEEDLFLAQPVVHGVTGGGLDRLTAHSLTEARQLEHKLRRLVEDKSLLERWLGW